MVFSYHLFLHSLVSQWMVSFYTAFLYDTLQIFCSICQLSTSGKIAGVDLSTQLASSAFFLNADNADNGKPAPVAGGPQQSDSMAFHESKRCMYHSKSIVVTSASTTIFRKTSAITAKNAICRSVTCMSQSIGRMELSWTLSASSSCQKPILQMLSVPQLVQCSDLLPNMR